MPRLVDPATGKAYDVPDADVGEAGSKYGLISEADYAAQQRARTTGGALAQGAEVVGAEVLRQGAGLISAVESALDVPQVAPGAGRPGAIAPESFSPEALAAREISPVATGIGQSVAPVAAAITTGGLGVGAGIAAGLGIDVASGVAQAGVDAELENRDVTGSDILRNAGLNVAFSAGLLGLGAGAQRMLRGNANALERAAQAAQQVASKRAAAAEGAGLVEAAADPAVRADLTDRLVLRATEAVDAAYARVEGAPRPKVANNPNAQRAALEEISDAFAKTDPEISARIAELMKKRGSQRLAGLREIRDELASGGETDPLRAIDGAVAREDLWGQGAIRGAQDVDAVLAGRPDASDPEAMIAWADAVRKVRGGEYAGLADQVEQLAERQLELRAASAVGGPLPANTNAAVDYQAAMRTMDPTEAWRLTKDGADEGLRRVEAHNVSDAFQRVDDVLKEDVAMSVKREDFVAGAEKWSGAQIAKQDAFAQQAREQAAALAGELMTAEARGYRIGGFAAQAADVIDRGIQRIADADPITRNLELDSLKRSLDSLGKRLAETGPAIDDASKIWGSKRIIETADSLRRGLEDAELFGRNAVLQTETNAAWSKLIDPYSRVQKRMAEFLGREFGVVGQAGMRRRFDPEMVERIMAGGYQRNLRQDIDASIKALDQMMVARQQNGLSHLDRLAAARADLEAIRDGFDLADVLAVAKAKAKAPLGIEAAQRLAGAIGQGIPGALGGAAAAPAFERATAAGLERIGMLAPGSTSAFTGALRKHLGRARANQGSLLADAAFSERLPQELQRQLMAAGEVSGNRAVEMATAAANAAKRDAELTAKLMVNPAAAKRAKQATRKNPAIERARARISQGGHTVLGKRSALAPERFRATRAVDEEMLQRSIRELPPVTLAELPHLSRDLVDKLDAATTNRWLKLTEKERAAVDAYAGNSYQSIRTLQKGEPLANDAPSFVERIKRQTSDLTKAEKKLALKNPTQYGPLYRGIAATPDMLDELMRHDQFITSASTSSSFNPMIALGFGGTDKKIVFRFNSLEKGASLMGEAGSREQEVLIPMGQKFRVTGRKKLNDNTLLVEVEQIGKASAKDTDELGSLGAVQFRPGKTRPGEVLAEIAKSPLGIGTGAAGAIGAARLMRDEPAPADPESMTPLQRFASDHDNPVDAFRAKRKILEDFRRNPEALIDVLIGEMGDVGAHSPKLEREMQAQAMRVVAYLQQYIPGRKNVSVVYPEGSTPSRAEIRQFALRWEAATDPSSVMADARMGRLERAQVETLQAVWPRDYDRLRAAVIQELGSGRADTHTRQRISLLFDFGSDVDPALGKRTRAIVAAARAAQEQKAKPAASSPAMSRKSLPSKAGLTPGGMSSLQLGQQMSF